jgi:hypothetical protein
MLEGVAYSWAWKLVTWLPGFLLRLWWPQERLASRISIDVRPRHSPVQINGGEISRADIWLELQNAGPFPVELDRMIVTAYLAGSSLDFYHLDRIILAPETRTEVHIQGAVPAGHIAHYARNLKHGNPMSLAVRAEFNSKIRQFSVRTDNLSGIDARNVNMPNISQ